MIELLLLAAAGLLGWFFAIRQKPTEPPAIPPKKHTPPTFEDKVDATVQAASDPTPDPMPDGDLAAWLDDHFKGRRK